MFASAGAAAAFGVAALMGTRLPPVPVPASVRTVRVFGKDRTFLVYSPPGRKGPSPAILAYPGSGETAAGFRRRLAPALEGIARERGFVVAYLQGFGSHFNDCRRHAPFTARTEGIDDVAFTRAVVLDLERQDGVDRGRVYALGYSNGGHMAFRLALEAPELVAGIVAVAANVPAGEDLVCRQVPGQLPAVVLVEGTRDPINPYEGGHVTIFGFGDRGNVLSARESAVWFALRAGSAVAVPRRPLGDAGDAEEQDFGNPACVRLITIPGGGHVVPQSAYRFPRLLGVTLRDDAVLESAFRFLAGSPRPSPAK